MIGLFRSGVRPAGSRLAAGIAVGLAVSSALVGCNAPSKTSTPDPTVTGDAPRIMFRHTGLDDHYGTVAIVSLSAPHGARTFTDLACDRVDATRTRTSCLQTVRGATTSYRWVETDNSWHQIQQVPLGGVPNRTRLSPDGKLVASTVFVTGHSYQQTAFSTVTEIRDVGGNSHGNLETFTLVIDGRTSTATDRNIWGVTFAADDRTFFATAATGGRTYLVKGDLQTKTLTSIRTNAECPSLSPNGRKVAYKVVVSDDGTAKHWTPAVLDLASGRQTVLTGEPRSVDDQIEWLDHTTILYGLPRADLAGVDDVWALSVDAQSSPRLLIENAWSPAVVR